MRTTLKVGAILITLFWAVALHASMSARFEVADYVTGVHDKATVKIYVSTGPEGYGIAKFGLKFTLPAGTGATANDIVFGNIFRPDVNFTKNATATSVVLFAHNTPGFPSIDPSDDELLFATVNFTIDPTMTGSATFPAALQGLQEGWNLTTGNKVDYKAADITMPANFTIPILNGFNFGTDENAVVEVDEDDPAVRISATNAAYFNCQIWTGAALVEQVAPLPARFTEIDFAASRLEETGNEKTVDGVVVKEYKIEFADRRGADLPVGYIGIINYEIYYEPGENYNGQFSLHYTAESTYEGVGGTDQDILPFNVAAVNDAPVVTILKINNQAPENLPAGQENPEILENDPLVVEVEVTDVDGDAFDFSIDDENNAYISLDRARVYGAWVAQGQAGVQGAVNLPPGKYVFTSTEPLDYDWVEHPNLSQDRGLKITVRDHGEPREGAEANQNITIKDKDRPQTDPANAVITPANPITTDALEINFDASADADGDRITYTIKWYKVFENAEPVFVLAETGAALQSTLSAVYIKKHDKLKAEVYSSTRPYGEGGVLVDSGIIVSNTVTVQNSAPVSDMTESELSVFVQKSDADAHVPKSTVTLKVKDLDGLKEETLKAWISTAAGKGTINGIGADEENATQLNLPEDTTQGTLNFTYTVNNPDDDEANDYDAFTITVKDSDGATVDIAFTVDYLTNPPPAFKWTLLSAYDPETQAETPAGGTTFSEVDADGAATVFYVKVEAWDADVVRPAGISNITLAAPGLGAVERVFWDKGQPIPAARAEAGTAVAVFSVATKGYETIVNAGDPPARPKSKDFPLTITVTDVFNDNITNTAPENGDLKVTINDDDQKPTAPTKMTLTPAANIVANTAVNIKAEGGTDADNDAIHYTYQWFYLKGGEGDPINAVDVADLPANSDALKKGNVIYAEAKSVTNPYNDDNDLRSSGVTKSAELTVGNSAPKAKADDVVAFGAAGTAYDNGGAEGDVTTATLVDVENFVTDIDVEDGVDKLAFTIVQDSLVFNLNPGDLTEAEVEACLAIDDTAKVYGDDVAITFTPIGEVVDFYGKFTFTIKATDESGDSATRQVSFEITPVNDPPTFRVKDIYVLPDDRGELVEAWFKVNMGGKKGYEDNQSIDACQVKLVNDTQAALFAVQPAVIAVDADGSKVPGALPNQWLYLTFTLNEDVQLGTQIEVTLQATDDGKFLVLGGDPQIAAGEASDDMTLKIVLGATPWYPIYALHCKDHPIHQVTILDGADVKAELIVEGDTLMPADYYDAGCPGFLPEEQFDIELRPWTASTGVIDQVCGVAPPLQVPDYTIPGKGELEYDLINKKFTINTPLSASYTLSITYPNGNIKVIKGVYTPNKDGLILPEVELPMEFFMAGDYTATVFGTNPEGDGEVSDPCEFTIVDDSAARLEWPDKGFVPADAANILIAAGLDNSTVKFSWPVLSAAQFYNIVVINSAGAVVAREDNLDTNTWEADLPVPKDVNTYSWWVEAVADKQRAVSFTWGFNLIKKTFAPLLHSVIANGTGVILNFAALYGEDPELLTYEVQYFSVDFDNIKNSKWYTFMLPGTIPLTDARPADGGFTTGGCLELNLPVDSKEGDFIQLRAFYNGKQAGNFVLYTVFED